jgi:hypothetical protein
MITKHEALDTLDRLEFFQWQRAGRELWLEKNSQLQDIDIACFVRDISNLREYIQTADVAPRAEWISVEGRLPERMKPVLVLATSRREDDGFDVLIAYHDRGEWEERSVHGDGGTVYAHVTHWMSLPEPPKAKQPKAKQPKDSENYEKKRLLAGDCFHGEIWYRCPYCFTGIEVHSIPKDRICHNCGKEYL